MEKKRRMASSVMLAALMITGVVGLIRAERVNKSGSGGVIWSTAEEEGDLVVRKGGDADGSTAVLEELDGGFSSLDGMLQWAIGIYRFFTFTSFFLCLSFKTFGYLLLWCC